MDNYGLIDLHLHLDGSLSLDSVKQLAQLQGIDLPDDETLLKMLQVSPECRNLNEYLEKFAFPCSLLQTKAAISQAVYNLKEELKAQGLIYAEIRFAPQLHTLKGLTQAEVVQAAVDGNNRSDFCSDLILCCMRGEDNHQQNTETVRVAKAFLGNGVCAIDLAGAEALYKTENFRDLFALADEMGIPFTIHAGEADGADSIYTALSYGAARIGHGVRCVEDGALMQKLADEKIALELCPTSNLNTNIYDDIKNYPIPALLNAGIKITINTDNITVSATNLKAEVEKIATAFNLTTEEIKTLSLNAADAAFADEKTKNRLKAEIESRFE